MRQPRLEPTRWERIWLNKAQPIRRPDGTLVVQCPECMHNLTACRNLQPGTRTLEVYQCTYSWCGKRFISVAGLHSHSDGDGAVR